MVKVGDKIENNRHGVNGTDIPVGATVKYEIGVDRGGVPFTVIEVDGKKMLDLGPVRKGYPTQRSHGQMGPMTVLTLPEQAA